MFFISLHCPQPLHSPCFSAVLAALGGFE